MFSNALKSFTSNIASNYVLSPSPTSHSGPWRIHDAKKKKTSHPVSVWVFERKSLDPGGGGGVGPLRGSSGASRDGLRAAQDEVVERLKSSASLLARLRHPCVLELVEPVEETRGGGLMFATEPVLCSLGTLLAEKDEEGAGRRRGERREREVEIDELEIQKGLLQVGKALEFLHESAGLVHANLTPEAVMVNAKSDWKLTSLSFTVPAASPPAPPQFDPRLPPHVQHALDYAAPELVLDAALAPAADLYSLGLLILALNNSPHASPLATHNSAATYRRLLAAPATTPAAHNNYLLPRPLPPTLAASLLPALLARTPAARLTAREFQQSPYFDNILVSTLRFLDALPAKTPLEKSTFLRGLPKILPQFPRGVLEKKLLPALVDELRDTATLALVLPAIFTIASTASPRVFQDRVLPHLTPVFIPADPKPPTTTAAATTTNRDREAGREAGLTVILTNISIITSKTTAREFKDSILPLYHLSLESPTPSLQDLALRTLPAILPTLDFPTLKTDVFPVIASVFTKTSSLGIKIRALEALKVLCGGSSSTSSGPEDGYERQRAARKEDCAVLDKYTVQERVVPLLKGIKTKEPAVMMAALEVVKVIGAICDREVVAMELLPGLWTMSFGPLLGLAQFQAFMAAIRALSNRIEAEQTRKLQEMGSSVGVPQGDFMAFGGVPGGERPGSTAEGEFEKLVFGKSVQKEAPVFSWSTPTLTPTPTGTGRIGGLSPPPVRRATPDVGLGAFKPMVPSPGGSNGMGMGVSSMGMSGNSIGSGSNSMGMSGSNGMGMNMGMNTNMSLNLTPLQPSPGFGSTTALRPQPTPPHQPTPSSGMTIDWSSALTAKKPSFSAPLTPRPASYSSTNQKSNGSGSMTLSFPSPQGSHPTILYGQTRQQAAPSPGGAFAGFMIPPPPGGMNLVIGSGGGKKEEKKGLDQWESLL